MKRSATRHVHGRLSSRQLNEKTWPAFESLFSSNGGVWGGCWCVFYQKPSGFEATDYEENRKLKHSLVRDGRAHGTIVYCGDSPVGWCQYGPKEELPRIDRKRGYRLGSPDAWRVTCLFVDKNHRRKGVAKTAVVDSVNAMKRKGIREVEAYPVTGRRTASLLWSGTPELFEGIGFSKAYDLGRSTSVYRMKIG